MKRSKAFRAELRWFGILSRVMGMYLAPLVVPLVLQKHSGSPGHKCRIRPPQPGHPWRVVRSSEPGQPHNILHGSCPLEGRDPDRSASKHRAPPTAQKPVVGAPLQPLPCVLHALRCAPPTNGQLDFKDMVRRYLNPLGRKGRSKTALSSKVESLIQLLDHHLLGQAHAVCNERLQIPLCKSATFNSTWRTSRQLATLYGLDEAAFEVTHLHRHVAGLQHLEANHGGTILGWERSGTNQCRCSWRSHRCPRSDKIKRMLGSLSVR